jgi:Rieske Fe-S protein
VIQGPRSRRDLLRMMLGASAGAPAVSTAGCAPPAERPLRIPLAELPEGQRVTVRLRGKPVELMREGDAVVARSLVCSHMGCEVKWQEEARRYQCPCHQGTYDAAGNVLAGQPPAPLRLVPARIEGDAVVVGAAPPTGA